jgi:carboxypeptidase Taq
VRITTRYRTDEFLSSMMGTMHETGHALYEQNLPTEWNHWPVGKARGMAIHESQSLFVEKQVARSAEFWDWAMPQVSKHLGEGALAGWDIADVLAHVHMIQRGLIRVDADEATYPLHVILRYELEQELVAGRMEASDIPEAWHAKMMEYLGLPTIESPQDGPMQDVHWPGGAFGYFPSYTLGALIAAQQWSAMEKTIPDAREQMRQGRFDAINDWRRTHIWREASRYSTPDLLKRATGEGLNAEHFMAHLRQRYLS